MIYSDASSFITCKRVLFHSSETNIKMYKNDRFYEHDQFKERYYSQRKPLIIIQNSDISN